MKLLKSLLALALVTSGFAAWAQWQWIDQDGHKVYSDRAPPPEVPEKSILKRPNARIPVKPVVTDAPEPPVDGAAAAVPVLPTPKVTGVDKDLEAKKKQATEAEAAKKKTDEERVTKAKIENCARAKQAKATLDSGTRIGRTNAAGEREIMDDAARAAESKRIAAIVASDCN